MEFFNDKVSPLDDAIAWSRAHPLSEEEISGLCRVRKKASDIGIHVSAIETSQKGKKSKIIPVIGVKVNF